MRQHRRRLNPKVSRSIMLILIFILVWSGVRMISATIERVSAEDPPVTTLVPASQALTDSHLLKNDTNSESTSIRLVAAGDIMFHDSQLQAGFDQASNTYDFHSVFELVQNIISEADLAIANFETTTAGSDHYKYMGYPRFNSPDEVVDAIKDAGFDVLTTVNNHSLDTGREGLLRTLEVLKQRDLDTVGTFSERPASRVLMKEVQGIKLAFLAYTESLNGLESSLTPDELDSMVNLVDERKVIEDIAFAKSQQADMIIAYMHWGNEYERDPSSKQQNLAKLMIDEGVGIILGSHPHVIQKSEMLESGGNSAFIIYSLGNFVSNQRVETLDNPYTEDGMILQLDIHKDKASGITSLNQVNYIPTWVYRDSVDGSETYTYKILPIMDSIEDPQLSPAFKSRMERSYNDSMEQMDQAAFQQYK